MENKFSIISDKEIIENILSSSNYSSFSLLVEKYQNMIFKLCLGFSINNEEAQDLFQDTFISAFEDLHKFRNKCNFSTWLYRVGVNVCLNHKRKRKLYIQEIDNNEFESKLSSLEYNPESILITKDIYSTINNEIDNLPSKQKIVFVLINFSQLSQKEIAEVMKISVGAVESLYQRAKNNLRKSVKLIEL